MKKFDECQIKKIKALSYVTFGVFDLIKCFYFFFDLATLGTLSNFVIGKKNILRLFDL